MTNEGFNSIDQQTSSDCLRCCLAMVTGMSYEQVPDFVAETGRDWFDKLAPWAVRNNFQAVRLRVTEDEAEFLPDPASTPGLWIATGPTKRGTNHAVVMQGGDLISDPYRDRVGLLKITGALLLIPIPAKGASLEDLSWAEASRDAMEGVSRTFRADLRRLAERLLQDAQEPWFQRQAHGLKEAATRILSLLERDL